MRIYTYTYSQVFYLPEDGSKGTETLWRQCNVQIRMCSIKYLYLVIFEYKINIQKAFENFYCYGSSHLLEEAAQIRRYEVVLPMGILRRRIPAPAFTSPMNPQINKFTDFWRFISDKQLMSLINTLC